MDQNNKKLLKFLLYIVGFGVILNFVLTHNSEFFTVVKYIFSLFIPLYIGIAIAFVINIPTTFFEKQISKKIKKQKLARGIGLSLSITILIGLLLALWFLIMPKFVDNIVMVKNSIPTAYTTVITWVEDYANYLPPDIITYIEGLNWNNIMLQGYKLLETGTQALFEGVFSMAGSALGYALNLIVGIVLAIYIVLDTEKIIQSFDKFVSIYFKKNSNQIIKIRKLTDKTFKNFITGQCTEALIFTVLCVVVMSVLKLPYATMLGPLVGVMCLVPVVGPWIGTIIGATLILMINPGQALVFIIVVIVLQQIEGNLIYPYVVGDSVGIPPMCVLFVITLGGTIGGIIGILLAVPTFGILYSLLKEDMDVKSNTKQIQKESNETPKSEKTN